jgi:MIP family channel proteins
VPKDWIRPALAEGIGVLFLVFIGAGSIVVDNVTGGDVGLIGIAVAHGLALSIAVFVTVNVSGGHINPVVTIASMLTGRMGLRLGIIYIVSQLGFAVVAVLLLKGLFPSVALEATHIGATTLNTAIAPWQGMLIEALLTFFLVTAVWANVTSTKVTSNQIVGFSIGLVIVFAILVGGPLTGASMNPARTFGPALVNNFWVAHWIYWAGPLLGGLVAAVLYERVILRTEAK